MYTAVYYADTEPFRDDALFAEALSCLPPQRLDKTARLRSVPDKALSLGAGLLLMKAIRSLLPEGRDLSEQLITGKLCFSYGEHGKPYLPGVSDFHFNISHSGSIAALAVSDREIGCDLERIRLADLRIARHFFSEKENELLDAAASKEEQNALFYRLWTLRESFLKVTGKGLSLSMRDFAIVLEEGQAKPDAVRVLRCADDQEYYYAEPSIAPGYCFALCRAGEYCKPSVHPVDFRADCTL